MNQITPEQAAIESARLFIGCYFVALVVVMIALGLLAAYLWPAWTPLEAFR